jgi:hypothetical protein
MRRKLGIGAALVGVALLVPFLCCFANPMLLIFLQPVNISNHSRETVRARPFGRGEGGGLHRPPLYWTRFPVAVPRIDAEFLVLPGESTSFIYDHDDINLCWLLVRSESSNWKVIRSSIDRPVCALDPNADGGCCRGLTEDFTFKIDELSSLPEAPDWLVNELCSGDGGC